MVMLGGSGDFFKTVDMKDGDVVTFKGQGDWVESTRFKYNDGNNRVDFNIKVELKGEEKQIRLNKTNRETLIAAYGNDTGKWIDKSATISKVKCMVAGKMQDCIILKVAGVDMTDDSGNLTGGDEAPF